MKITLNCQSKDKRRNKPKEKVIRPVWNGVNLDDFDKVVESEEFLSKDNVLAKSKANDKFVGEFPKA